MLKKRITDATFGSGEPQYIKEVTREASRGVVFNKNGEIAMLFMKQNEAFKLPGGGIEGIETKEATFLREIREEMGYDLSFCKYIGSIEEHKNQTGFYQYSHCFIGRIGTTQYEIDLTDQEKALGLQLCWMDPQEAYTKMKYYLVKCHDYQLKFMVLRDLYIIKYVIEHELITGHEA